MRYAEREAQMRQIIESNPKITYTEMARALNVKRETLYALAKRFKISIHAKDGRGCGGDRRRAITERSRALLEWYRATVEAERAGRRPPSRPELPPLPPR